jgi:acyl dehydratase
MPPRVIPSLDSLKELVGQEIGCSEWFAVTQDRIQRFAEVTEDPQWIHLDRERAQRESPYGTTIAHGFLTLSLISCLARQAIEIRTGVRMAVNYGLNRVRYPAPVPVDSRIRARFTLAGLKEIPGALEATFSASVESERTEKPCCAAEWIVRYCRE